MSYVAPRPGGSNAKSRARANGASPPSSPRPIDPGSRPSPRAPSSSRRTTSSSWARQERARATWSRVSGSGWSRTGSGSLPAHGEPGPEAPGGTPGPRPRRSHPLQVQSAHPRRLLLRDLGACGDQRALRTHRRALPAPGGHHSQAGRGGGAGRRDARGRAAIGLTRPRKRFHACRKTGTRPRLRL